MKNDLKYKIIKHETMYENYTDTKYILKIKNGIFFYSEVGLIHENGRLSTTSMSSDYSGSSIKFNSIEEVLVVIENYKKYLRTLPIKIIIKEIVLKDSNGN